MHASFFLPSLFSLLFDHSSPRCFSPHSSFSPLFSPLLKAPLFQEPASITYLRFFFFLLISTRQASSFHYCFISLFWHSGNNRQTSLFVSISLFFSLSLSLPSFPSFSRSSGFEQAATSSQAHLLARANKTKATFPELNLLLRLSSVNWEFSSLKSGGVTGWLLAANLFTPFFCV